MPHTEQTVSDSVHELAFAEQILKAVEREAREHGAQRVVCVRLRLGKLSGVDKGSLSFCLEAIAAGSIMDAARIEVTEIAPELICSTCGHFSVESTLIPVCPVCGKEADLSAATGLYLQEIELHDEED